MTIPTYFPETKYVQHAAYFCCSFHQCGLVDSCGPRHPLLFLATMSKRQPICLPLIGNKTDGLRCSLRRRWWWRALRGQRTNLLANPFAVCKPVPHQSALSLTSIRRRLDGETVLKCTSVRSLDLFHCR